MAEIGVADLPQEKAAHISKYSPYYAVADGFVIAAPEKHDAHADTEQNHGAPGPLAQNPELAPLFISEVLLKSLDRSLAHRFGDMAAAIHI